MKSAAILLALAAKAISTQSLITLDLECKISKNSCRKVHQGFALATKFLENALKLTKPINIKADYSDYTEDPKWDSNTLGKCSPITQTVDNVIYPQALLKQLSISNATMKPYDMELSIDSRHEYFFPNEYANDQSRDENTFLDTVCHEILHGMGLATSFIKDNDKFSPNYIKHTVDSRVSFTFFTNAFEKHIYTRDGHSIAYLVDQMNKENQSFTESSTVTVRYSERQAKIANTIRNYVQTTNGLYFRTSDKKKVFLETGQPLDLGSKVAHISSKYSKTTDRLIVPRLLTGQGIHDITKKGWKTSPFGQRTLKILKTMGYKLNPHPKYENSLAHFNDKKNHIKRNTKQTPANKRNPQKESRKNTKPSKGRKRVDRSYYSSHVEPNSYKTIQSNTQTYSPIPY